MKKLQVLGTVCALLLSFSASTNAAFILADSDFGDNDVIINANHPGLTDIDIVFNSMTPIWLHFDNGGEPDDELIINRIINETGVAWTDFHFEFDGASPPSVFNITPLTGTEVNAITTRSSVWLFYDPPETAGLVNVRELITSVPGVDYWLHIAPSAVPVPAAVWLFGSGLLGLIGMARRKKA